MASPPMVGVPALVWWPLGPVLPDQLADVAGAQHADEQRGPDQGEDEGGRRRQQQRDHEASRGGSAALSGDTPGPQGPASRAAATRSRPATRLALTSTASPAAAGA